MTLSASAPAAPCAHSCCSSAAALLSATLACVRTAPCLLRHRPSLHPIRETCVAVVRRRGGARQSGAAVALARATLAMDLAAPGLLANGPAGLPVRESISAIVRVGWGRRRCWPPANVMVVTAPPLLRLEPAKVLTDSAVVWIDRAMGRWNGRRHRRHKRRLGGRQGGRPSGRRGGGWRRRWRRRLGGGGRRRLRG